MSHLTHTMWNFDSVLMQKVLVSRANCCIAGFQPEVSHLVLDCWSCLKSYLLCSNANISGSVRCNWVQPYRSFQGNLPCLIEFSIALYLLAQAQTLSPYFWENLHNTTNQPINSYFLINKQMDMKIRWKWCYMQ